MTEVLLPAASVESRDSRSESYSWAWVGSSLLKRCLRHRETRKFIEPKTNLTKARQTKVGSGRARGAPATRKYEQRLKMVR